MKIIQIVIGALGMVPKVLEKEMEELKIRGKIETSKYSIIKIG